MSTPPRLVAVRDHLDSASALLPPTTSLVQQVDDLRRSLLQLIPHVGAAPGDWAVRSTQAQMRLGCVLSGLRAILAGDTVEIGLSASATPGRLTCLGQVESRLTAAARLIVQLTSTYPHQRRRELEVALLDAMPRLDDELQLLQWRLDSGDAVQAGGPTRHIRDS